jgi:hypothetical protein
MEANTFGEPALERRLDIVMYRVFGAVLDQDEQEALNPLLAAYVGKLFALDLIIPGIDFWSKQAISHSAGERESKTYKDRAEDLKELRKLIFADAVAMLPDVEAELPQIPRRLGNYSRVQEAGLLTAHVTSDPLSFPPLYGPPEETTTG